jgi:plastocyanin
MNINYLIGIVVAVVVIMGGLMLLNRDDTDTSIESDDDSTSMEVPASGEENVDEMVEDNEGDSMVEDENMEKDDVDAMEESDIGPVTINYTSDGFSPSTVTINSGDTVIWKNQSDRNMWVASAVHPTHTIYPEQSEGQCLGSAFDACEATPKDSVYEFTFNETGSWKYHNHTRSAHIGTVVVE